MPEKKKVGVRGVQPDFPWNNRFRRMTGLCGLTTAEAGAYLGLAQTTAEQKIAGTRGMKEREEAELRSLWRMIRSGPTLDPTQFPKGAIRQQLAYREMLAMMAGEPLPDDELRWPTGPTPEERDEEMRGDERPAKPIADSPVFNAIRRKRRAAPGS